MCIIPGNARVQVWAGYVVSQSHMVPKSGKGFRGQTMRRNAWMGEHNSDQRFGFFPGWSSAFAAVPLASAWRANIPSTAPDPIYLPAAPPGRLSGERLPSAGYDRTRWTMIAAINPAAAYRGSARTPASRAHAHSWLSGSHQRQSGHQLDAQPQLGPRGSQCRPCDASRSGSINN